MAGINTKGKMNITELDFDGIKSNLKTYLKGQTEFTDYDFEGSYAQAGYFFNELIPSVPEELELAFRYAFVDEPDSSSIRETNNREEYTIAANYFIAGHSNKVTLDYSYLTLDDASEKRSYNDNRVRLQWDISF